MALRAAGSVDRCRRISS